MRAGRFDGLAHARDFMGRQIVHHHDIAGRQFRHEHLLDIGPKGETMHRAVEQHGRDNATEPQTGGEGRGLPVTVGKRRPAALALWRPAALPGHLGIRSGLVDEDQPVRIEVNLAVEPGPPPGEDVRALLFRCMACLFLCVSPRLEKKYQIVAAQVFKPRSVASLSAIS